MSKCQITFLVSILLVFSLGLVMVFNTTSAEILDRGLDKSTSCSVVRQLFYAFLGSCGVFVIWFLGYENIIKFSGLLLAFMTLFLVLVFVPGIGQQINGANRWIGIGGAGFQPSEFVKYLIPIYYIQFISKDPITPGVKAEGYTIKYKQFLKWVAIMMVPVFLIFIEPDNGTVFIIFSSMVAVFVLTKLNLKYWLLPLCILLSIGVIAASQMPHVSDRIKVYLHPELDIRGKGHQPYQAKIAAGSGGLWGRGLGESLQKLDYLPEARNDYIAAIYAEELGFVGVLFLIVLYMLQGYFGFYMATKCVDKKAFYLVAILTFIICFQAFLNLGVVSGLLPSKGVNLPFFSQGGSSLTANIMMVALILNAAIGRGKEICLKEKKY